MGMYLRELYKAGTEEELKTAEGFFERSWVEKSAEERSCCAVRSSLCS